MSAIEDQDFVGSWLSPEQIEFHCYNRILSVLSDHLYDVYQSTTSTTKELWKTLEAEYGTVDAGIDRFIVSNFNGYKMKDDILVGDQIHEFQELLRKVEKKGTTFNEEFKVSCLIDKLPQSWNDFAKRLRHKQGDLSLTQLINTLRVEEKHRSNLETGKEKTPKVNVVENGNKNSSNNRNNIRPKGKIFKNNLKFRSRGQNGKHHNNNYQASANNFKGQGSGKRLCYVCGRANHYAKDCFFKKTDEYKPRFNNKQRSQGHNAQVNMVLGKEEIAEPSFRNQVEEV
ncbi:hypothetical protein CsSME_00009953 [Camellia sinensis var. sinensis]